MLNHQHLLYDANGRIRCTSLVPRQFGGGTPTRDRLLCVSSGAAEVYSGGLGYRLTGHICSTQALNPANGMLGSLDGAVRSTPNNPTHYYCGLPFAANGLMSVAPPESE